MNRQQRRNLKNKNKKKYTPAQIELAKLMYLRSQFKGRFNEGDKIKLNMEFMTAAPSWERKESPFRAWCEDHADDVMTVEYDADHLVEPELVCLAEDKTQPKWLFSVMDLMPATGDDSFMDTVEWVRKSYKKEPTSKGGLSKNQGLHRPHES